MKNKFEELEIAERYLKDMKKRDKELKNYYGWSNLPKYLIKESK